jgi:hypothetical protein
LPGGDTRTDTYPHDPALYLRIAGRPPRAPARRPTRRAARRSGRRRALRRRPPTGSAPPRRWTGWAPPASRCRWSLLPLQVPLGFRGCPAQISACRRDAGLAALRPHRAAGMKAHLGISFIRSRFQSGKLAGKTRGFAFEALCSTQGRGTTRWALPHTLHDGQLTPCNSAHDTWQGVLVPYAAFGKFGRCKACAQVSSSAQACTALCSCDCRFIMPDPWSVLTHNAFTSTGPSPAPPHAQLLMANSRAACFDIVFVVYKPGTSSTP